MKVLIYIGGGESFSTREAYLEWLRSTYITWVTLPWQSSKKRWKHALADQWIQSGGIVYIPEMPNALNAKYAEWKIVLTAILQNIGPEDEVTFIGHSLGGCFLLQYFSEGNIVTRKPLHIQGVHLVASCIECGDFRAPENYDLLRSLKSRVHIWHAEDDRVVPFSIGEGLAKLLPDAETHFFTAQRAYGHFHGIERFPELENTLAMPEASRTMGDIF